MRYSKSEFCPKCGEATAIEVDLGSVKKVLRLTCACQRFEMETEEKRRAEETKLRKKATARHTAFLSDKRLEESTFERDDGKHPTQALLTAKGYAEKMPLDFGILFFGESDAGKSFLAACIANAAIDKGMSVMMRSLPWIVRNSTEDMERTLIECDLLILDDLGAERNTSYGREIVYSVVDSRYKTKKPMIVTTNLTRRELAAPDDREERRIYARILEACLPIEVDSGRKRATRELYEHMRSELG